MLQHNYLSAQMHPLAQMMNRSVTSWLRCLLSPKLPPVFTPNILLNPTSSPHLHCYSKSFHCHESFTFIVPGGTVVKNLPANQSRRYQRYGFDPWVSRRSHRVGSGNPFWYFCLKNSMNRGAWWATVHGVTKIQATEHSTATRKICPQVMPGITPLPKLMPHPPKSLLQLNNFL